MSNTVYPTVDINGEKLGDWASFHQTFASSFGFPEFYGRNMDAWIDCMSSLDSPADGLTSIHAPTGGVVTIRIENVEMLRAKAPDIWNALNECSAFVNWRRMEMGEPPVLALSYYK